MRTMTEAAAGFLVCSMVLAVSTALAQESGNDVRSVELEIEEQAQVDAELEREVERLTEQARIYAAGGEADMRAAESRLAAAARRVAELSTRNLPVTAASSWTSTLTTRPVLGVSIGAEETGQPVEGVEILGVSPAGPADEAGLQAGDVLTTINGESLAGGSVAEASRRLLDFMAGVDVGDELEVEFLRGGRAQTVSIVPRGTPQILSFTDDGRSLAFRLPPAAPAAPGAPPSPRAQHFSRYIFMTDDGIGDMEMVSLTEGLGRYFGTDEGLLVVRAPGNADTYKLQDGDVILNIDGREPRSVSHALRILGSYQSGETLSIRIMRDKRARTLEIEIPDERTGAQNLLPDVRFDSEIEIVPRTRVAPQVATPGGDDSA